MKYKINIHKSFYCIFKYEYCDTDNPKTYGNRYLYYPTSSHDHVDIYEDPVMGFNDGAVFISNRAMFKLAAINNFLDKLKEMCSTDLNTKQ